MSRDPWIPAMLGLAYLGIVWVLCKLARIGWLYLCALTCWLLEWWDNRRERLARKKESDAYGTAEAVRRQSINMMARAVRAEDRRELSARVRNDVEKRGYQTWNGSTINDPAPNVAAPSSPASTTLCGARTSSLASAGAVAISGPSDHWTPQATHLPQSDPHPQRSAHGAVEGGVVGSTGISDEGGHGYDMGRFTPRDAA